MLCCTPVILLYNCDAQDNCLGTPWWKAKAEELFQMCCFNPTGKKRFTTLCLTLLLVSWRIAHQHYYLVPHQHLNYIAGNNPGPKGFRTKAHLVQCHSLFSPINALFLVRTPTQSAVQDENLDQLVSWQSSWQGSWQCWVMAGMALANFRHSLMSACVPSSWRHDTARRIQRRRVTKASLECVGGHKVYLLLFQQIDWLSQQVFKNAR